jgi:hypothetical protein
MRLGNWFAIWPLVAGIGMAGEKPPAPATGACDGSTVLSVGAGHFLSASDEDNTIRLYKSSGGAALWSRDFSEFLELTGKKKPKEADIEAGARIGNRIYWVGSHGRDKKGNAEPSRHRLFATDVSGTGKAAILKEAGHPAKGLLVSLLKQESAALAALKEAETKPHEKGGIDIEGMAATVNKTLLIGFRSPLVNGKAIVVELLNPAELVATSAEAKFGKVELVDMGGRGVRDLIPGSGGKSFIVLAGSPGTEGNFRLFDWTPGTKPLESNIKFPEQRNWEGIARDEATGRYLFAADEGEAGTPKCKDREGERRSFNFRLSPVTK